jgi:hypothetical protein
MRRIQHAVKAGSLGAALVLTGLSASANTSPNDPNDPTLAPATDLNIAEGLQAVVSKISMQIYGYLKVDAAYDSSEMDDGNFARWVESGGGDNQDFNITGRQTRLGLKIGGPTDSKIRATARVEVDFYGTGFAEDSPALRMRHAYVNLDLPESDFSLLMGQTADVVSPLVMPTLNYTGAWFSGDMGYRSNQIRLTKGFNLGGSSRLLVQAAATRSIGGENTGAAGFQGRLGFSFDGMGDKQTTLGVSTAVAPEANNTDADAFAIDLVMPLLKGLSLKSEYYLGDNTDTYLGGIDQGVNDLGDEIQASGYWAALTYSGCESWTFNAGYARDNVKLSHLMDGSATNYRTDNSTLYGNANYAVTSNTTIGFELAQHKTGYLLLPNQCGTRAQLALTLKF